METPPPPGPTAGPPLPPPPPFGSPRPRELRRLPDQGPVAGVCAGVAEYFNVDPVIVRIATIVLAITGPGVIAYGLAWIFLPVAEGSAGPASRPPGDGRDRGMQILGIVLLAIAVSVLWGDWWSPARGWMFPLGLMALGAWLLLRRDPDQGAAPAGAAPGAVEPVHTPAAAAPLLDVDAAEGPTDLLDTTGPLDTTNVVDTTGIDVLSAEPPTGDPWPGAAGPPTAPWASGPPPAPEGNGGAARRRRVLGPIVMGALLVWSGVAWLAGVSVETGLAVGLCIVGIGFVLGAFVGGSWALILPAIAIAGALIVATVADIPLSGPIGERTWAPREPSALQDRYELSIGEGTLDLTQLSLDPRERLVVEASVGIGHLVIEVPDGVALDITADVSAGEARLLGIADSGMGVSTRRSFPGRSDAATIELDLKVGLGQIEVRHRGIDLRTTTPSLSTTTVSTLG